MYRFFKKLLAKLMYYEDLFFAYGAFITSNVNHSTLKRFSAYHMQYLKSGQIQSYFWSVFSCIQTEYRKIRTRNNSVFGHFSRSNTIFVAYL